MSSPTPRPPLGLSSREDSIFPTLTPERVARVTAHGRVRPVRAGEVLASAGQHVEAFFVVAAGSIELLRESKDAEEIGGVERPGQFTGEINMLPVGTRSSASGSARQGK